MGVNIPPTWFTFSTNEITYYYQGIPTIGHYRTGSLNIDTLDWSRSDWKGEGCSMDTAYVRDLRQVASQDFIDLDLFTKVTRRPLIKFVVKNSSVF